MNSKTIFLTASIASFFLSAAAQTPKVYKIQADKIKATIQSTELDHLYFLRDAKPIELAAPDLINPPPGFSTATE